MKWMGFDSSAMYVFEWREYLCTLGVSTSYCNARIYAGCMGGSGQSCSFY